MIPLLFNLVVDHQQTDLETERSAVMASIRFTSFFLALILLHFRDSTTTQTQALGHKEVYSEVRKLGADGVRTRIDQLDEEIQDGFDSVAEVLVKPKRVIGRKVMVMKEKGLKGSEESKISSGEACNKIRARRGKRRRLHETDVELSGLVAFNADYHVPRPHPP